MNFFVIRNRLFHCFYIAPIIYFSIRNMSAEQLITLLLICWDEENQVLNEAAGTLMITHQQTIMLTKEDFRKLQSHPDNRWNSRVSLHHSVIYNISVYIIDLLCVLTVSLTFSELIFKSDCISLFVVSSTYI